MRVDPSASDCLVLDFVDLSALEIITTATLAAGRQPAQPEREAGGERPAYLPLPEDDRDEAPATLAEITRRLREFDPLTMVQSEEAAAISINAWLSLGARGMMLHFLDHAGQLRHFELRPAPRSGVEIWREERRLTRCSSMSAAIEAVDYELPKHGDPTSARADAPWRRHPITAPLKRALAELRPPRRADTVGDAIAHLALELGLDPGPVPPAAPRHK